MPELVTPTVQLRAAWQAAHAEWGPGSHEDGFGLLPHDDVCTPRGFAAWVNRLRESARAETATGETPTTYWWIVDSDTVLGGIALRHTDNDRVLQVGHIGYGIRPSARRRGLATWALGHVLPEARNLGLEHVLICCEDSNSASARVAEVHGAVLEGVVDTVTGPVRRYWIDLAV